MVGLSMFGSVVTILLLNSDADALVLVRGAFSRGVECGGGIIMKYFRVVAAEGVLTQFWIAAAVLIAWTRRAHAPSASAAT